MRGGKTSRFVAEVAVFAAAYAGVTWVLPGISFSIFNIRVANALRGFVPRIGWGAVVGLTFGVFLANIMSPIGILDVLSVAIVFVGLVTIYYLSKIKMWLGFIPHWLLLTSWLSWLIGNFVNMPYLMMFAILAPQLFISDFVLPVLTMYAFEKIYPAVRRR
jgi:hypothetical protein